jgi:hypothetical protein
LIFVDSDVQVKTATASKTQDGPKQIYRGFEAAWVPFAKISRQSAPLTTLLKTYGHPSKLAVYKPSIPMYHPK